MRTERDRPADRRSTIWRVVRVSSGNFLSGFTPAVCTYLIERTGNHAAPALWLSLAAVISLPGFWVLGSRFRVLFRVPGSGFCSGFWVSREP
jgi:hypothetical protein